VVLVVAVVYYTVYWKTLCCASSLPYHYHRLLGIFVVNDLQLIPGIIGTVKVLSGFFELMPEKVVASVCAP
jgi:hypothetical protein